MRVGVVAEFSVRDEQKDIFLQKVEELVTLTNKEEGCIAYDLYEADDETGVWAMLEIWASQEALDKHLKSEHFLRIVPALDEYQTAPVKARFFNML
jgi:quinol monooxygenase YgiN